MVTSSNLPERPIVVLFPLSLSKAAQKKLTLFFRQKFRSQDIRICLLTLAGGIANSNPTFDSNNIAVKTWGLFNLEKDKWIKDILAKDL